MRRAVGANRAPRRRRRVAAAARARPCARGRARREPLGAGAAGSRIAVSCLEHMRASYACACTGPPFPMRRRKRAGECRWAAACTGREGLQRCPGGTTDLQTEMSCEPWRVPAHQMEQQPACPATAPHAREAHACATVKTSRSYAHRHTPRCGTTTRLSRTCTSAPRPRPGGRQRRAAAAVARRARLARRRRWRRRSRRSRRRRSRGGRGRGSRLWGQVLGRQRRRPAAAHARARARARRRPHGARRRRAVRVRGGERGGRVVRLCSPMPRVRVCSHQAHVSSEAHTHSPSTPLCRRGAAARRETPINRT